MRNNNEFFIHLLIFNITTIKLSFSLVFGEKPCSIERNTIKYKESGRGYETTLSFKLFFNYVLPFTL